MGCVSSPGGQPAAQATPSRLNGSWSELGLRGSLVTIAYLDGGSQLVRIDLETGEMGVLFQAPPGGILSGAAVSPDGQQIAITYSPPPPQGESFLFPSLYLLPVQGEPAPVPIFRDPDRDDAYTNPDWMADGQSLVAAHYRRGSQGGQADRYTVERIGLDGSATVLIEGAAWPQVSPDGTLLAYLSVNTDTNTNLLFVAGIDGSQSRPVLDDNPNISTVDAPIFTPDGQGLVFSAPSPEPVTIHRPGWFESWGVQVVSAHTVPSELFEIALDGTQPPTQLTAFQQQGLYPAFSPDGQNLVTISQSGIYWIRGEGSAAQQLTDLAVSGTLEWLP